MTATATLDTREAIRIGTETMRTHGLIQMGWTFKVNSNKSRLGVCKYPHFNPRTWSRTGGEIGISVYCIQSGMDIFMETLLHEIAHAIVGSDAGHGPRWKQKARELGCKGERCGTFTAEVPAKYVGTCPNCGATLRAHRQMRGMDRRVHLPCVNVFPKPYVTWVQMY